MAIIVSSVWKASLNLMFAATRNFWMQWPDAKLFWILQKPFAVWTEKSCFKFVKMSKTTFLQLVDLFCVFLEKNGFEKNNLFHQEIMNNFQSVVYKFLTQVNEHWIAIVQKKLEKSLQSKSER